MLLKLNMDFRGKKAGDVIDRDLEYARRMIEQGIADQVEKSIEEPKVDKMVHGAPKSKAAPQRRKRQSNKGRASTP